MFLIIRWLGNLLTLVVLVPSILFAPGMLFGPQGDLNPDRYVGGQSALFVVLAQNGMPAENFEVSVVKTQMTDRFGNVYPFWNGRSCVTNANGSCIIEHMPAGEYLFSELVENFYGEYYAVSYCPEKFTIGTFMMTEVVVRAVIVSRSGWSVLSSAPNPCQSQMD